MHFSRALGPWIPPLLLFGLWYATSTYVGTSRLPSPYTTAKLLISSASRDSIIEAQGGGEGGYLPHVSSTAIAVFKSVSVGGISAIILALAVNHFRRLRAVTNVVLGLLKGLPPLIFVPFAAVSLAGTNDVRLLSVLIYSHINLLVYALNGLSAVDKNLLCLAALLGAGRVRRAFTVELPSILPGLLGPFRLVTAFGLGVSIVAEYLVSPDRKTVV